MFKVEKRRFRNTLPNVGGERDEQTAAQWLRRAAGGAAEAVHLPARSSTLPKAITGRCLLLAQDLLGARFAGRSKEGSAMVRAAATLATAPRNSCSADIHVGIGGDLNPEEGRV